jgi:hypothetical protein
MTSDRQYVITGAVIDLKDTKFGGDVTVRTDDDGKFNVDWKWAVGDNYGVYAVYDGSSKFVSSKSQTEYFIVTSTTPTIPPTQPQTPTPTSGSFEWVWILVILGAVFGGVAVVIISKNKKKTPRATPQRKTFGTKQPRKRQITPQPPVGMPSSVDGPSTYGYFECPNCHEPSAPQGKLKQNPDGSQFCSKCGWRS